MKVQKEYNNCHSLNECKNCLSNNMCGEWVKFVQSHGEKKGYAHFDNRVSLAMPTIKSYVLSSEKIAKHGFYPLIHFKLKNFKFGKKSKHKLRELFYCAHLDRCVYQRYSFLINYHYNLWVHEKCIDNVAIAYRDNKDKNNIDFAKNAFEQIKKYGKCFVFVGDFTNFFDKLNHKYLKEMLCKVLKTDFLAEDYYAVFKNITRFSYIDWEDILKAAGENIQTRGIRRKMNSQEIILSKSQFRNAKQYIKKHTDPFGIPQGSPISAVLSNVYMIEFDQYINEYVLSNNGIFMRYSDDFIIILPYEHESEINAHTEFIFDYFDSLDGLVELQKEKTAQYIFDKNQIYEFPSGKTSQIDYLGFIYDGKIIRMRPKAITKYYYRMRRKAHTIGKSGWISKYGRHITAKELYDIYSYGGERQTFIDYAKKAKKGKRKI